MLSLFSGIGAFEKALDRCEIDYKLVNYCEIDKYAAKSYSLIHHVTEDMNLGDIVKVDVSKIENIDLVTYGFPCTDISVAGKQTGFVDKNGKRTRSGLFFEALRIIENTQPKIAICENVKALTGKKFAKEFQTVLNNLENAGYVNYYKVLNANDYGMPQNRQRVFIVSIRKDIDKGFNFPEPIPLKKQLKDVLEDNVDEKYYLNSKMVEKIIEYNQKRNSSGIIQVAQIYPNSGNPQAGRIYESSGISPSLDTCQGGNRMPKIIVYDDYNNRVKADQSCIGTLTTNIGNTAPRNETKIIELSNQNIKIRKLTPKECFRLMGFDDNDVDILIKNQISDSQLYKMAGNSIVVNVLEGIFTNLRQYGYM